MDIYEYKNAVELDSKNQTEKAVLLCYYHLKSTDETLFDMKGICELFSDFGYSAINSSRVKSTLIKNKKMRIPKGLKTCLEFVPATIQELDKTYASIWNDTESIKSDSELLEENKFCGKRNYLDKLIKQINFSYGNNCYDACAVLMRRLFEVLLVLTYQHTGNDDAIKKDDGSYLMLEGIVKDAVQNKALAIPSRISKNFNSFREVGNNSAHSITYTAGQKDITDIKRNYRVMMEDLYNRAGLI